jgi:hypothetical protein
MAHTRRANRTNLTFMPLTYFHFPSARTALVYINLEIMHF